MDLTVFALENKYVKLDFLVHHGHTKHPNTNVMEKYLSSFRLCSTYTRRVAVFSCTYCSSLRNYCSSVLFFLV